MPAPKNNKNSKMRARIQAEGPYLSEVEKERTREGYAKCIYDVTKNFDIVVLARFKNRPMLDDFFKEH